MLKIHPDFRDLLSFFNSENVRYLILGGYAVNFYGHHRNTKDIDIWIATDPANAAGVSSALTRFGFAAASVPVENFQIPEKVYVFGREPLRVDILTGPTGIDFNECYPRRVEADLDGLRVTFISLDDLKTNKRASARTRDISDLENLPERQLP
jgi:predicted nucleotidyltransferase